MMLKMDKVDGGMKREQHKKVYCLVEKQQTTSVCGVQMDSHRIMMKMNTYIRRQKYSIVQTYTG